MNLVKLSALALGGLLTLTACGGGTDLSGTYEGDLDCNLDVPTVLTLAENEDENDEFNGELVMEVPVQITNPSTGELLTVVGDFISTVTATIDPKEEAQDVDMDIEVDRVENCTRDGQNLDSCEAIEGILDQNDFQDLLDIGDVEFDGENTLEVDSGDCEGDLERPEPS